MLVVADAATGIDTARPRTPDGWPEPPKRLGLAVVNTRGWPPEFHPDVYVCGPTSFVEAVSQALVQGGYPPQRVKTERFGATGGT